MQVSSIKTSLLKLLPESRKLRVMMLSVFGYALHSQFPFMTQEQVLTIMGTVAVWLFGQSYADAGAQGQAIAEIRKAKKAGLNPQAVIDAVKDREVSKEDLELIIQQMTLLGATVSNLEAIAQKSEPETPEEPEEPEENAGEENSEENSEETSEEEPEENSEEAPEEDDIRLSDAEADAATPPPVKKKKAVKKKK